MPTSVLLAVLAAAGLLALAPALVRRYDATERLVAERALSTARVLPRRRRRRSVPGRYPVRTSRVLLVTLRAPVPEFDEDDPAAPPRAGSDRADGSWPPDRNDRLSRGDRLQRGERTLRSERVPRSGRRARSERAARAERGMWTERGLRAERGWAERGLRTVSADGRTARTGAARRRPPAGRYAPAVYRRRRVFASLVLLNLAELLGVVLVGPGFWSGFSVTITLLVGYAIHLRNLAIADHRRQRAQAREAAWLAARQAEVRREQARRAAARREVQRRLAEQREAVRRAAQGHRPSSTAAAGGGSGAGVTSASYSYRRAGGLRGRPYQAGPPSSHTAHSA